MLAVGCIVVAALSLLVLREPTYDPMAWLVWGRQITEWDLHTVAGPSWKPLPVLFTTPFALAGDDGAIYLWLVVARVGGLAALILGYRLAARFYGPPAGIVAVLCLVLANDFVFNWTRGNSEGLLVALFLLAFLRHLDGKHVEAFLWGVTTALLRPEMWALLAVYGLWLLHERRDGRTALVVFVSGVAVAVLWFLPEYLGSGDFLRAASRAREPVEGSPGASDAPFVNTFTNSAKALTYGGYAGAVAALVPAWRDRRIALLAGCSAVLMLIVAALASGGFTGNIRYVALPMALVCVLAGIGWGWALRTIEPRAVVAVLALATVPGLVVATRTLGDNVQRMRDVDAINGALVPLIDDVGGPRAVLRCGPVTTGPFKTQLLAYRLHVRQNQVRVKPAPAGAILDVSGTPLGSTPGYEKVVRRTTWILRTTC